MEWIDSWKTQRALALLCAIALSPACRKPAASLTPAAPVVTVTRVIQREVIDWDEYTGRLESPELSNVSARVSGFIEQTPFKEGALVKKGDVLFVIDDRPFKADLENKRAVVAKDEAQASLAKIQLARNSQLLKTRVIAPQDYDTSKANYDQAQAQLASDKAAAETSRLNLEWTRVTAPIAGRISRINVTVGNLVNGGPGQATLLTTIVSVDPLYCYVPVPERLYLKYQAVAEAKETLLRKEKLACRLRLENETGFPHKGYIDFIDNSVDRTTGTIQVRGVIANPDGVLTPGLFARMQINGSGAYKALLVPDAAIGATQNQRYVLVVGNDDVVSSRAVKLGSLFGSLRSITDGVHPGERVVVDGLQKAQPGKRVAPREAPISQEAIGMLELTPEDAAIAEPAPVSEAIP